MKFCEKQRLIGFHHKALHFSSKEKLSPGQSNDKTTYHKSHHLSMIPFQKSRALEQSPDRTELEQDHIFSINRLFVSCGSFLWLPLLTYMCDFINITIHQPWISFFINHKKNRCWKTKFTCCRQDWYTYIYIYIHIALFFYLYIDKYYMYTYKYAFKPTGASNSTTQNLSAFRIPWVPWSQSWWPWRWCRLPGRGMEQGGCWFQQPFSMKGDEDEDFLMNHELFVIKNCVIYLIYQCFITILPHLNLLSFNNFFDD